MTVIRAAIEFGSGGVRFAIGETDFAQKKIEALYEQHYCEIPFMETVNKKGIIDGEVTALALDKLKEFKELLDRYKPKTIVAVATEAFRVANNKTDLLKIFSETLGVQVQLIDQKKEGEIGFLTFAHLAQSAGCPLPLVSWDTGKGSEQLSFLDAEGKMIVHKTSIGYAIAADQIFAKEIRKIDPQKSYNPISQNELDLLISTLKKRFPEVSIPLKEAVSKGSVIRLYTTPLFPTLFGVDKKPRVALEQVKEILSRLVDKDDAAIEKEFKAKLPFLGHLPIYISMLQATMEHIGIPEIHYVNSPSPSGNTQGMLISPDLTQDFEVNFH